jgi:hypothetical protein
MQLRVIRTKTYPIFGRVVGVRFQVTPGEERFKKIARELEADEQVKVLITDSHRLGREDIQIKVCAKYSSWLIEVPLSGVYINTDGLNNVA